MVLVSPTVLANSQSLMERVVSLRKKPWKLARLLGLTFVFKFFMQQLSLSELERRVSQLLGVRGVAIISPYPEIGTDVDKPSDLELAERVIGTVSGSREA